MTKAVVKDWLRTNATAIIVALCTGVAACLGWAYNVGQTQKEYLTKIEAADTYVRKDVATEQFRTLQIDLQSIKLMQERNSDKLDQIDTSFRNYVLEDKR